MNTYFSPKVELIETELMSSKAATNPIILMIGPAATGSEESPVFVQSIRQFVSTFGNPKGITAAESACYLLKQKCIVLYKRVCSTDNPGTADSVEGGKKATADFVKVIGDDIYKLSFTTVYKSDLYNNYKIICDFNSSNSLLTITVKDTNNKQVVKYENLYFDSAHKEDKKYAPTVLKNRESFLALSIDTPQIGDATSGNVITLVGGNNGSVFNFSNEADKKVYTDAIDLFSNPDTYNYSFMLLPGVSNIDIHKAVYKMLDGEGTDGNKPRKDFVFFPEIPASTNIETFLGDVTQVKTGGEDLPDDEKYLYGSSYSAIYYPDATVVSAVNSSSFKAPASVIGCSVNVKAFNSTGNIWTPGAGCYSADLLINDIVSIDKFLTVSERDSLCANKIPVNPITYTNGIGYWINGNKTSMYYDVQADYESVFNNLHIRKLVNHIKGLVINTSRGFLFRNNNETTWSAWRYSVSSILDNILSKEGIEKYKVVMDESTVSEEDIKNNTAPGLIYIKPTKVIEYLKLTLNVTEDSVYFEEDGI